MKKLLKIYGLTNDFEYYTIITESFINGQITQAKEQFKAMPKSNRIDFMKCAQDDLFSIDKNNFNRLIELI